MGALFFALVSLGMPRGRGVGMAVAQGDGACSFTDPATGKHYDLTEMQHGKDYEKVGKLAVQTTKARTHTHTHTKHIL